MVTKDVYHITTDLMGFIILIVYTYTPVLCGNPHSTTSFMAYQASVGEKGRWHLTRRFHLISRCHEQVHLGHYISQIQSCIMRLTHPEPEPYDHKFAKYINVDYCTTSNACGKYGSVSNIVEKWDVGVFWIILSVIEGILFSHLATLSGESPQTKLDGGLRSRIPSYFGMKCFPWIHNPFSNGRHIVRIYAYSVWLRLSYESTTILVVWSLR